MGGIYIHDVNLPGDGDFELWIAVKKDGSFAYNVHGAWREGNQKAVPVPSHGRLIDEKDICDKIRPLIENPYCYNRLQVISETLGNCLQIVRDAPTIIPADGKGYILAPQEEYDGLKRKYVVLKSDSGEPVEDCFVLRPDKDKAAIAALLAYADTTDNQVLAKDIRAWISTIPAEEGEK